MLFVLYTICISPHQMPLYIEMEHALGSENCRFIYTQPLEDGRKTLGWHEHHNETMLYMQEHQSECNKILEECTVLMSNVRDFNLFETRSSRGLLTLYASERWLKPVYGPTWLGMSRFPLSGGLKLFHPGYLRMVLRFRRLLCSKRENNFYYLPISLNAAKDAAFFCSGSKSIHFENQAGGKVIGESSSKAQRWQNRLRLWGYFVASSTCFPTALKELRLKQQQEVQNGQRPLRLLWVGRMLALKNVDKIIEAVRIVNHKSKSNTVQLTLVGGGEEKAYLEKLSHGLPVEFRPFVPIEQVRQIMREHDLYVFASNSFDGWGAVISEALEELMPVIASKASGAGYTVLPDECLFDYHHPEEIAKRIIKFKQLPKVNAEKWSAKYAAKYIVHNFYK